ncbi:hypothetical protein EDB86DRAFT_2273747 [Lactarius hatsudake]|nr:hypothetical protein EDB86DRAFT_2273747 [Lactarius hatsudake]
MDSRHMRQSINAHTGRAGGQSRPEPHSWFLVHGSGPEYYSRPSNTSSLQSYYTSPQQSDISSQSYYSARESPSNSTTNSTSTPSSDTSFPYSVTSINSRKSRKSVLYPRREHPPPVAAASEHSISLDTFLLSVGPNLASTVPLYNLIAVRGDPSCACGKSSPPVIGGQWIFFETCACSDRRRNPLLCRIIYCVGS